MADDDPWGQDVLIANLNDAPNAQALAQALAYGIVPRTVMLFASASERAATLTGAQAPTEGMVTWLADADRLDVYTGSAWVPPPSVLTTVTTGATAGAGYSVVSFSGRRRSDVVTVHIVVTRTGSDIGANGSGNITDMVLATLPSGWRPPETMNAVVGDGFADGEAWIEATGVITLRSWSPNGVVTAGRNMHLTLTFVA